MRSITETKYGDYWITGKQKSEPFFVNVYRKGDIADYGLRIISRKEADEAIMRDSAAKPMRGYKPLYRIKVTFHVKPEMTTNVRDFLMDNTKRPVVEGTANSVGGGGAYRLYRSKKWWYFTVDEARSMPEGFPRWKLD